MALTYPLDEQARKILDATHTDPFSYLGPHVSADGKVTVRSLQPQAHTLSVVLNATGETFVGDLLHPNGLFEVALPSKCWGQPYELVWHTQDGRCTASRIPIPLASAGGAGHALFPRGQALASV